MKPIVSIIMGSTSDMPVMRKAAAFLDEMEIPFEINALSAHRTPQLVEDFASNAHENGIKVITFEQANEIGLKFQEEYYAKHKDNSANLANILNKNNKS